MRYLTLNNAYVDYELHGAWLAWQARAALAAPVVEAAQTGAPTTVDLNLWKHRIMPQGTEQPSSLHWDEPERRDVSPGKVMLSLEDLGALANTAERNGTQHGFVGIALQWAAQANAEIQRLRAARPPAVEAEPVLYRPARVGNATFGVGVATRLVVEAAQRQHEYHAEEKARTPEQWREMERNRRALWDMTNGPLEPTERRDVLPQPVAPGDVARQLAAATSLETVSAPLANVVRTAPERIYLVIGEDCPDDESFMGSPDDNDDESLPWDIRAAIDAAMNTEAKNG